MCKDMSKSSDKYLYSAGASQSCYLKAFSAGFPLENGAKPVINAALFMIICFLDGLIWLKRLF